MKEITIGDKSLMQISKEDILQLAVMQGCCAHLDFWNYPTLLEYDNTMFSDTVVISYKSTRKEDGIESILKECPKPKKMPIFSYKQE